MLQNKIQSEHPFRPNPRRADEKAQTEVYERLYEEGMKRLDSQSKNDCQSIGDSCKSKTKSQRKLSTVSRNPTIRSLVGSKNPSCELSAFNTHSQMTSRRDQGTASGMSTHRGGLSRDSSNKSLRSQKGLSVTKNMDVQAVCERKLQSNAPEKQVNAQKVK